MCHVTCYKFNTQFEFSGWREEGRWTGTKQDTPIPSAHETTLYSA